MQTRSGKIGTANNMQLPWVPPAALCAANRDKRNNLLDIFNSHGRELNPGHFFGFG